MLQMLQEKEIKHGAHFYVSMGLTKTDASGVVTQDTCTVQVNDPFGVKILKKNRCKRNSSKKKSCKR